MYNFGSIPFFASNNNLVEKNPSGVPSCYVSPTIIGRTNVGSIVSVRVGSWTNTPSRFDYKWYIDNSFTSDLETFEIDERFLGMYVKCVITASNNYGLSVASTASVLITEY